MSDTAKYLLIQNLKQYFIAEFNVELTKSNIKEILEITNEPIFSEIEKRNNLLSHSIRDMPDGNMEKHDGQQRIDELRILRNAINGE